MCSNRATVLHSLPSVYEYLDYRAFLRDHYAAKKAGDTKFSFRFFARRAGFTSSNFLKLVMDGDRNLGPTTVERVANAMKLDASEVEFFSLLVQMNQAQTVADRNRAFERVAANRRFRAAKKLDGPLFEYLTRWYYPVIRELAGRDDFVEDAAWIAAEVYPPIEVKEARAALKTLEKLGLLVREGDRLVRGDASVTTGHEVRHVVVPAYHLQMIERAAKAVERVAVEERDVSSLTVCIREATLAELKAKIRRFREEMLDRCDSDGEPERVYQLCIQLFPMSKKREPAGPSKKGRASSLPPRRRG
ncbi:MAG: TIGR02147 family protein [Polyangiaceae bacterium]|nr:TIGR02147 family protein [Polyangiaceae bacterium]